MKIIFIFFIGIHSARAKDETTDRLNVGTVLFTPEDVDKKRWDLYTVDLLKARRYFQNIIPSPHLIDTVNEEYLEYLQKYIKDAYEIIKREVNDPGMRTLMNYALSDTLGGYLKIWILPISKYSYYGGTISLNNALSVFKMYEDIKRDLNTDGNGWRNTDRDLLNYVAIDVHTPAYASIDTTCDDLMYYEKSSSGYTLPLPCVDWSIEPGTMFVPMKNKSLIPLNSNSSGSLVKYYGLIKNCVNNLENWKNFDDRFQTWLLSEIAPHLNDDNLYVPFEGVLGLMNKTKSYTGKMFKWLNNDCHINKSHEMKGMFPSWCTKKFIIGAVLLIELVWCVPTFIYIICSYMRKRNNPSSFCFCVRNVNEDSESLITDTDSSSNSKRSYNSSVKQSSKIINNVEHSSYYDSKHSNIKEGNEKYFNALSHYEAPCDAVKNTFSKCKPSFHSNISKTRSSHHSNYKTECERQGKKILKEGRSNQCQSDKNQSKSKTKINKSENIIQNIGSSQSNMKQEHPIEGQRSRNNYKANEVKVQNQSKASLSSPVQKHINKRYFSNTEKSDVTIILDSENNKEHSICKGTSCLKNRDGEKEKNTDKRKSTIKTKLYGKVPNIKKYNPGMKNEGNKCMEQRNTHSKDTALSISASKKDSVKPLLEINIKRPKTDVKLGISTYKEHTVKNLRPSRIPRFTPDKEFNEKNKIVNAKTISTRAKSKHPSKITKGSLDDSILQVTEKDIDVKLNVTL